VASVSKIPIQPTLRKAAKRDRGSKEAIGNWQIAKEANRNGRKGRKGDWKSGAYFLLCVLRVLCGEKGLAECRPLIAECYVL
jgi:hypothetical protein